MAVQKMYVPMPVVDWSAFLFVKYDESKLTVFSIVLRVLIVSEYVMLTRNSPSDGIASKSAVVYSFESKSPTTIRFAPLISIVSCFGISTLSASTSEDSMFRISKVSSFVE